MRTAKGDLIREIIRRDPVMGTRVIKSYNQGEILWVIQERYLTRYTTQKEILCYVLKKARKGWKMKDFFKEGEQTNYLSCPLDFFDVVKQSPNSNGIKWRGMVIREHENRTQFVENFIQKSKNGNKVKLFFQETIIPYGYFVKMKENDKVECEFEGRTFHVKSYRIYDFQVTPIHLTDIPKWEQEQIEYEMMLEQIMY